MIVRDVSSARPLSPGGPPNGRMGRMSGGAGMRKCSTCGHVFFAHGPAGCRTCGCTSTRGGLFKPDTPPEEILQTLLPVDPRSMERDDALPDENAWREAALGQAGAEEDGIVSPEASRVGSAAQERRTCSQPRQAVPEN